MFNSHRWKTMIIGALLLAPGASFADVAEDLDTYQEETNAGMGVLSSRISTLESAGKFKTKADIRVRHEMFTQKEDETLVGEKKTFNRGRSRIRLRFGVSKEVADGVNAAFGLATGSTTDPTSTNQTLDGNFTEKGVYVDYAYLQYVPEFLPRLTFTGGKMLNPLKVSAANWDGDTNPEGFFGNFQITPKTNIRGGWFVLKENSGAPPSHKEYGMNVFQLERNLNLFGMAAVAAVGYQYVPFSNKLVGGAPDPIKNGNLKDAKGVLRDFKVLDYLLEVKKSGYTLLLHWCRNTNSFDIPARPADPAVKNNNENAYLVELKRGSIAAKGDRAWNLRWGYIEPNAVLAMFPDSDAEYTNRKYLRASVSYGLANGLQLDVTQFGIKRVNYSVISAESREPLYRTQVDFVVKL